MTELRVVAGEREPSLRGSSCSRRRLGGAIIGAAERRRRTIVSQFNVELRVSHPVRQGTVQDAVEGRTRKVWCLLSPYFYMFQPFLDIPFLYRVTHCLDDVWWWIMWWGWDCRILTPEAEVVFLFYMCGGNTSTFVELRERCISFKRTLSSKSQQIDMFFFSFSDLALWFRGAGGPWYNLMPGHSELYEGSEIPAEPCRLKKESCWCIRELEYQWR